MRKRGVAGAADPPPNAATKASVVSTTLFRGCAPIDLVPVSQKISQSSEGTVHLLNISEFTIKETLRDVPACSRGAEK